MNHLYVIYMFRKYRDLQFRHDKVLLLIILLIVFYGLYLRIANIDQNQLWIDEGMTIMQQRAVLEHGYPLLMSGFVEWKDCLLPYILASITVLLGEENFIIFKIIAGIFSTASIVVIFLISQSLINRNMATITSFMLAFSYWHIAWSRQVRSYTMLIFFILLTFLFIIYFEKKHQDRYLVLAGLAIIFAVLSKTIFGILLLATFLLYLWLKKRYKLVFLILVPALFFGLFFGKLLLSTMSHGFVNYFDQYVIGYLWNYYGIIFLLSVTGSVLAFHRDKVNRHVHVVMLSFSVGLIIFLSFFSYVMQYRYLFVITPIIFIYCTYFIYYLANSLSLHIKLNVVYISIIILTTIILIDFVSVRSLNFVSQKQYKLEQSVPQPEFYAAYEYIKNDMQNNDIIVSPYPYLDLIFLEKFNYILPISYTGDEDDVPVHSGVGFYTGAQELVTTDQIKELSSYHDIYFILDGMGYSRVDRRMLHYIRSGADIVFINDIDNQLIVVFKVPQNALIDKNL